jgi:hypothetical protein
MTQTYNEISGFWQNANKIRIRRKKKYAYPTQTKVEERFTATKGGGERKI